MIQPLSWPLERGSHLCGLKQVLREDSAARHERPSHTPPPHEQAHAYRQLHGLLPWRAQADIYGHVLEFNAKVAALYTQRLKSDTQLRVFELQAVDLALAVEELHAATRFREKVG